MSATIPAQAQVVIVGGGIAGASVAYHLTKLGCSDVVLLEQGKLTCGTTWHAAGLVGQLRATRNATRMSRYGIELYATLEAAKPGSRPDGRQCGSLNVAKTPERLKLLKRQMARARGFGIDFEFITPGEAGKIYPLLRTDDLSGAVWIPGDGKANPTDLTQSLAKGARMRGARIVEGAAVTGVIVERGGVAGVRYRRRAGRRRDPLREPGQLRGAMGARIRQARRRQRAACFRPSISTSSPGRSQACTPTCQ